MGPLAARTLTHERCGRINSRSSLSASSNHGFPSYEGNKPPGPIEQSGNYMGGRPGA